MEKAEPELPQPMTPAGRLFLQNRMNQVINCAIIGEQPPSSLDVIKTNFKNSIIFKHPRFSSLLVHDSSGREHWKRTHIDIDRHVIHLTAPLSEDSFTSDEDAVNGYLADLASTPLPTDKPLWEFHVIQAHNAAVFRVHHALGDGVSLMSIFLSCCRNTEDPTQTPELPALSDGAFRKRWSLWQLVCLFWFSLVYVVELVMRLLWRRDQTTALSGGAGVEDWPRSLATARFRLHDMKTVKRAVPGATINDVLFGVISRGFSRYLDSRCTKALDDGVQLTGVAMVNLRRQPEFQDLCRMIENGEFGLEMGNKFGMILLPVYYRKCDLNPLGSVKKAKEMIDKKKLSLEAFFSYKLLHWITAFTGAKLASFLNYRVVCNTTFTISNIVGPKEKISLSGNPLKYIRVTSSSLPHAITMHMISYAGFADMQILVAKDLIPDPKSLAACLEDALLEMKEAADASVKI